MGNFDLKTLMAEGKVPNLGPKDGREQIEYIHIDLIDDDPNNFYELSALDELAANIELLGLQQPLRVRPNPKDPSRVVIVSGHRRRAAIRVLVDAGHTELAEIPCIQESGTGSAALQELRLIYANSDIRKLTAAEIGKQAVRVEMLLYQLKEEGYEFPGRMRDHVAEACKVSKSKLARLKVIRENLSPDFMNAFEKNTLTEQAAYSLARLPLEFQHRLFRVAPIKSMLGHSVEVIQRMYEKGTRWEPEMTCPDGKSCTHGDAALRHDLDEYERCGGEKCCLTCSAATRNWSPCARMCSKATAQRKAAKEAEDAKSAAKQAERTNSAQKKTQINAQRLLKAIDAAGVSDKTKITWDWHETTVSEIRKYAAGEFSEKDSWHSERLSPDDLRKPTAVAKILGCSTDFLFGLTDELTPTGAESPPERTGVAWYPCSVEPEGGTDIVVVDDLGCSDNGRYYSGGNFDGEVRWDEVVFWTPHPTAATPTAEPPAEGWVPLQYLPGLEPPATEGQLAVGKFMVPGLEKPMRTIACWRDGYWRFPRGGRIEAECTEWFPLPADKEAPDEET